MQGGHPSEQYTGPPRRPGGGGEGEGRGKETMNSVNPRIAVFGVSFLPLSPHTPNSKHPVMPHTSPLR